MRVSDPGLVTLVREGGVMAADDGRQRPDDDGAGQAVTGAMQQTIGPNCRPDLVQTSGVHDRRHCGVIKQEDEAM